MEKVVKIKRCSAVVKGGRRFSFAAMVVVGDGNGKGRLGLRQGQRSAAECRKSRQGRDAEHGLRRPSRFHDSPRGQRALSVPLG